MVMMKMTMMMVIPLSSVCCFPVPGLSRLSLNISPFTFQLGFVHPPQDVALHQCLPLSSVCCFPDPGGSPFLVMSPCRLLLGRPLDLFPLFVATLQRLVHLFLLYVLAYLYMSLENWYSCGYPSRCLAV